MVCYSLTQTTFIVPIQDLGSLSTKLDPSQFFLQLTLPMYILKMVLCHVGVMGVQNKNSLIKPLLCLSHTAVSTGFLRVV